jgi:transcriptional regulator
MIFYDYYANVPNEAIDEFMKTQPMGRLITTSKDGGPHIGLYPFLYLGSTIELHLHRDDEQLIDLIANPKCVFQCDDIHTTVPSHWIHPTNAAFATAYYRFVEYKCHSEIITSSQELSEQQKRLMQHFQPEGGYQPITENTSAYQGSLNAIAGLRLTLGDRRVKWKLGQNRNPQARKQVIEHLRERNAQNDREAADAMQWALDLERKPSDSGSNT